MRNTIRTAFGAALALAAAALCALLTETAPTALAEGESTGVTKVRLGSLKRDDLVVVDVTGVPGGGGTGSVDTNAVRDIVREELGDLRPDDIGALPADYEPPVLSVNGKDGDVELGPADIGALPDTYVPPVTSVNGRTGDVVVAVSDVAGAVTSNDVESIVGRHYETNTSVRIGIVEDRVSATERWQYADGVTRSAVESGFTSWAVGFADPPAGSSPPYDAVVAQVMASGYPTDQWSLFAPTDTMHSAETALLAPVLAPTDATNLTWAVSSWGPVTATRVRVPTARELDAKAEAKDLQAATTSLSNDVSRLDEALAGTKADLAAVAEAKADRVITEYELDPPRMDTNDVWVVDLDDTVLHFSGEDAVDGFQTWAGTNDSNSVWVCEDGDSNVLARAVSYLLEVTVGPDPVVSSLKVLDVATSRRCGLPTSQYGTAVIVYPPDTLPMDGFKEDDLRYEYDASAVPAYSKVLLSYRDAGNGNAITNAASIGRGRRRRIETGVVYGTGLEKAVAGLRDDLVSRRAVETGFTEWAIESDRPLGEDVVPGLVEGGGLWSLFPAGSTDRSQSAALTTTFVGGGVSATNLSWDAGATTWGAVRATRTRVPTMTDLKTIENTASSRWDTVSTYIPWLEDYATNNYAAARLANRRAKDLEAWRYTNAVTRADIERGMTDWAVTPMWPLGRVVVGRITGGAGAGKWTLFRPGESEPLPLANLTPQDAGDEPMRLEWGDVQIDVDARWTNGLNKAGIAYDNLREVEAGKTNVTAYMDIKASRVRVTPGDYAAVSNAAMAALSRAEARAVSVYYPDGGVTSAADITSGIKYTLTSNATERTAMVKPFCNSLEAMDDNSSLSGRVVIPPFIDADGHPFLFDDGTMFKVIAVDFGTWYDYNTNLKAVVAPTTVTSIGGISFASCTSLMSVSFPSATEVDNAAFDGCTTLTSVSFPAATTIGGSAFSGCDALVSVSLPAATTIGNQAFYGCDALVSVSLPAATTIGSGVFDSCTSLTSVSLPAATSIGNGAFYGCTSLTSVDFGDTSRSSVPTLGGSAFYGVPNTCKIIVPDAQYDAWTAASGWSGLVMQGYKFLRHSEWEYARRYETTLTPIHSQTPTFSEWTIKRDGVDVTSQVAQPYFEYDPDILLWMVHRSRIVGDEDLDTTVDAPTDTLTLEWQAYREEDGKMIFFTYTATRVRTDIVGYTLGDQTDKPLAPGPVAPKRYPLFIIDLNPGEARNWCHIELKATTNNFTHATASNMIFFTSSTCNETNAASFGLTFEYDWCRLYVMSKRTNGGSGDVRAWTRIRRTGDFINLTHDDGSLGLTYAPLTLLVIVDPDARYFKRIPGFAQWLREDNDELTWSYVRISGGGDAETDQDGKQCWRPAMPVRWYEKLPSWADEEPTVIDNSNIAEYAVPWEAASAASTSNVLETAKTMFRSLADEQVYEPAGYSDFAWSSDRADIVEALGDMQPSDYWDDGDYREWYLSFSIGPTNYWGYAYDAKNAPQVTFSLWGEYYDYDSDMYYEDYDVTVLGRRKVSGYSLADPVDTFAHQRELTTINASLSSVRNYVDGETKVLRTGEPGQLGTGWGYVSHSITNDHRRWRFRVPKWNVASGMPARSLGLTQTYRTVDDPSTQNTGFSTVYGGFMTALPSWFPQYTLNRRVLETRGIYGTDACQFADYVVGLWPLSEDGTGENAYAARYSVMHTSASPMRFVTTLLTNDLHSSLFKVDVAVSGGGTVPGYFRYVDFPPVTNTVIRNFSENRTSYSYGNNKYVYYDKGTGTVVSVLKAVGFVPSMAGADPVTTENSIPLKLSFISDQTCDETHTTYTTLHPSYPTSTHVPYTNSVSHSVSVTDMLYTMSLSIPCNSATTFEDVAADYYKLLSTLDSDRHLYYDAEADVSYRVTVSNGCFYAEKVMDGNWQRGGL